jgi:hypothetical protein
MAAPARRMVRPGQATSAAGRAAWAAAGYHTAAAVAADSGSSGGRPSRREGEAAGRRPPTAASAAGSPTALLAGRPAAGASPTIGKMARSMAIRSHRARWATRTTSGSRGAAGRAAGCCCRPSRKTPAGRSRGLRPRPATACDPSRAKGSTMRLVRSRAEVAARRERAANGRVIEGERESDEE